MNAKVWQLLDVVLTLFDGSAGGEGPGAAAPGGAASGLQGETQAFPGSTRRGGSSETGRAGQKITGVTHAPQGRQSSPAMAGGGETGGGPSDAGKEEKGGEDNPSAAKTPEERRQAWRELIEGEYKDLYAEDTQRIISRRVKEAKTLQGQLDAARPVLDLLLERYKISDGDLGKLQTALESDDAYWTQAAEEAGLNVEQFRRIKKLEAENASMRRAQARRMADEREQRQYQRWDEEAAQAKKAYPSFDLAREVKDPQFLSMLRAGVPVKHAYEVIHMEEIKAGVAALQAKATEKQVVDGIRAKGARPAENGMGAQSGFTVRTDVSKLTKQERSEIARRTSRGEKIRF